MRIFLSDQVRCHDGTLGHDPHANDFVRSTARARRSARASRGRSRMKAERTSWEGNSRIWTSDSSPSTDRTRVTTRA
jgi:hypothetical protein